MLDYFVFLFGVCTPYIWHICPGDFSALFLGGVSNAFLGSRFGAVFSDWGLRFITSPPSSSWQHGSMAAWQVETGRMVVDLFVDTKTRNGNHTMQTQYRQPRRWVIRSDRVCYQWFFVLIYLYMMYRI